MPGLLQAQKAGDIISGVVQDSEGPLMMVNVTERDAADRIVNHAITDMEGNFSFRLVNPEDRLQITYVGYETVDIPIDKTYFEIDMKEQGGDIPEVEITAERYQETTGLKIPLRETSGVVQTINMDEFADLGLTTVDEALAGQVAGLDIVFDSGDLGARSSMRLRGQSTLTGDGNPLIVVDGIILSIDKNTENQFADGLDKYLSAGLEAQFEQDRLAELLSLNPSDIQSISFLKDASATALWGMRGANGVMEITTKRGQRGATRVNYSYNLNLNFQPKGYNYLNGDQYTMFVKESLFNPHLNDALTNDIWEINYVKTKPDYEMWNDNTDWVGAVKRVGVAHQHNVSISGGGDKAHFMVSANYDTETGTVIGQRMNRFTTRVNFDYFISERIKVQTNFSLSYSNNRRSGNTAVNTAQEMMPNLAIYYEDPLTGEPTGTYYLMPESSSSDLPRQNNPLLEAEEKESYQISLSVNPDFRITYNLLGLDPTTDHRLTYEGSVNFGVSNNTNESFTPQSLSRNGWQDQNANTTSSSASKSSNINTNHSLTFEPHLNNKNHHIMAFASMSIENRNGKDMNTGIGGLPSGTFRSVGLPGRITGMSTGASRSRNVGISTQIHYSYKSKYNITFTTRSDGTTRTGNAKKWGTFPAASARWNISDEKWFDSVRESGLLTMVGFQMSWGFTGNAPGGDDMFRSRYSSGKSYMGVSTIYPANIRLSDFQWEESTQWNYGLNLGMFDDKITAQINFYHTTTDKLINNNFPIPSSSGYTSLPAVNDGKMMNEGWDLRVSAGRIYSTRLAGKDFSIGGNVNFSDNTNQILEMNDIVLKNWQQDFDMNNPHTKYLSYVALKNSYGSIYGFKYKGIYQYSDYSEVEVPGVSGPNAPVVKDADGNVILNSKGKTKPMVFGFGELTNYYEFVGGDVEYEDINHDGNINELDIVYLGSSLPKINGGFSLNARWGRLSWSNNFSFRYGNRIVNASRLGAEAPRELRNVMAAINWRWRVEGDVTEVPRTLYKWGYNDLGSDRYVEDGSFMRWTSSSLNYNVDPKLTKKIHLSGLTFSCSVSNLATWTKYTGLDPEVSSGRGQVATDNSRTPRSRRVTFRVNVNF
ncbi:MAG: SusC/RagA family TonB-linked outer membrane protein [Bacteroidaceae bacterium]|nr:SusC/RagA family TonB-linked outer membrane protein [Bacteroidaceae bacterium]